MNCKLVGAMSAALALLSSAAHANETAQIYGQPLTVTLPLEWKKVHDRELGGMHSVEFVPEGQTLAEWQEIICLQGFQGMASRVNVAEFLDAFAARYRESCQGDWTFDAFGEMAGGQGVHAVMGCSRIANQHSANGKPGVMAEMGYFQVLAGSREIYLLHRSSRGLDFNSMKQDYQGQNGDKPSSLKISLPSS